MSIVVNIVIFFYFILFLFIIGILYYWFIMRSFNENIKFISYFFVVWCKIKRYRIVMYSWLEGIGM